MGSGGGGNNGQIIFPQFQSHLYGLMFYDLPVDWQGRTRGPLVFDTIEQDNFYPSWTTLNSSIGDHVMGEHSLVKIYNKLITENSPYYVAEAYNPDSDIVAVADKATEVYNDVTEITTSSVNNDAGDLLDSVVLKLNNSVFTDADIDAEVSAYEQGSRNQFLQSVGRFVSSMADIGAAGASSLYFGIALLESQRLNDISRFRSELSRARNDTRYRMIESMTRDRLQYVMLKHNLLQRVFDNEVTYRRFKIVALVDQQNVDMDYDVKEALWDFEVASRMGNTMSTLSGSVVYGEKEPNKIQSALSGALAGASVGSAIGGPIGAGIGGLLGAAGGFF
jgi:hypothetical protein